jgi:hypothetical protein
MTKGGSYFTKKTRGVKKLYGKEGVREAGGEI